jgi:hypothetical protein
MHPHTGSGTSTLHQVVHRLARTAWGVSAAAAVLLLPAPSALAVQHVRLVTRAQLTCTCYNRARPDNHCRLQFFRSNH